MKGKINQCSNFKDLFSLGRNVNTSNATDCVCHIHSVEFLYKINTQGLYRLPASWQPGYIGLDEGVTTDVNRDSAGATQVSG